MKLLHLSVPMIIALTLTACASGKSNEQSQAAAAPSAPAAAVAPPAQPQQVAAAPAKAPSPEALYVYFDAGSAKLGPEAAATADTGARLYREGHPTVMLVVGHTDATGKELDNLVLSARRAAAVKEALVGRGIPASILQIQAKGQSDLAVPASADRPEPQDRRVVVTWR